MATYNILLIIGASILVGYFAGEVCDKVDQPKVVGWILGGVFLGPSCLNILHEPLLS